MSSDVPVGLYRTYARIPDDMEFNYENWCRSVVMGRSFLSGGPIIHFSVEGSEIGDTVNIRGQDIGLWVVYFQGVTSDSCEVEDKYVLWPFFNNGLYPNEGKRD